MGELWEKLKNKVKSKDKKSPVSPPPSGTVIKGGPVQLTVTPPSYASIRDGYKAFNEASAQLLLSNAKHSKKTEYESLIKSKGELDEKYGKAMEVAVPLSMTTQEMADAREGMQSEKTVSDAKKEGMQDKVQKNIAAREGLEKYKSSSPHLILVIKKASDLKETEDAQAQNPQPKSAPSPAEIAHKKSEKAEKGMKVADIIDKLMSIVGTICNGVSDGLATLKDGGVDTAETIEKLKKAEISRGEALKSGAGGVGGGFGIAAAGLAVLNSIIAMVDLGRKIAAASKNHKAGLSDAQEKKQDAREILMGLCRACSSLLGAGAMFAALVPVLGPSLGIIDSGLQLVMAVVNLSSHGSHWADMHGEKQRIWKEIERKRKKYGSSMDAGFFDIDNSMKEESRRPDWDKIDAQRKGLQQVVSSDHGLTKEVFDSKKAARNKTGYAAAETGISSRISELREKKHQGMLNEQEQKDYKRKMHAMEALELMAQYRNVEKAEKKMRKASGHDVESIIVSGTKIIGNALTLAGEITAASGYGASLIAAGVGVNMSVGAYEGARQLGSWGYKGVRILAGSEKSKQNTRSEMAEYLFDKMLSLGPKRVAWEGGFFKLDDSVPDYRVREIGRSVDELNAVLRRGLDARVSSLLKAPNSQVMKESLAAAFSQDGN
ncbi:MAG: hypothetical protein ACI4D5_05080 [Kineothrix sp.]